MAAGAAGAEDDDYDAEDGDLLPAAAALASAAPAAAPGASLAPTAMATAPISAVKAEAAPPPQVVPAPPPALASAQLRQSAGQLEAQQQEKAKASAKFSPSSPEVLQSFCLQTPLENP